MFGGLVNDFERITPGCRVSKRKEFVLISHLIINNFEGEKKIGFKSAELESLETADLEAISIRKGI